MRRSPALLALVVGGLAFGASRAETVSSLFRPFGEARQATSTRGMVVSAAPEASRAGASILAAGGNSIDAAVATAFALAVVYPQAGNLAGGGFLVAREASGKVHALDFRETAPAATSSRSFLGTDGSPIPGRSLASGLAVGVPGSVRGLEEAHRKLGHLAWSRLLQPAIRLAQDGFDVPEGLARSVLVARERLARTEAGRRAFLPGGEPIRAGNRLRQPELAATLVEIASRGADAFHRGRIAAVLAREVRRWGGVMTAEDLEGYRPVWRVPFEVDYDGWHIVTMPLPSTGGFVLASVLGQIRAVSTDWRDPFDPATVHLFAEAERRAYADRNALLGDPDCVSVPLQALLAPRRLLALGASIDPARATASAAVVAGAGQEHEQTTHLSVATADGGAVSLTTTLNEGFGSGLVAEGLGVFLNNEMDDFTTAPGVPNLYQLVLGASNEVRAGARPLSGMSPVIVLRDGRPALVIGSPGGSTIPTTVLQVFLHAGPRGLALQSAVEAARFHHQHLPDALFVEKGAVPDSLRLALEKRGHRLLERGPIGQVHAIAFEPSGVLRGVADPRGYGAPAAP